MARQRSMRPARSVRPPRSRPPPVPASGFALRQIVRYHGGVDPGMLDALLEEITPQRLEELKAESNAGELLALATKALLRADLTLREAKQERRRMLRGFSPEMLALAADQAFRLVHLQEQYDRVVEDTAREKAALEDAMTRAGALIEQASWVLRKVCAKDDVLRRAIDLGKTVDEHGRRQIPLLIDLLTRLARAGERLVRGGTAAVKNRAILYGLDGSYLETLIKTSALLAELHAKVKDGSRLSAAQQALDEVHARTAFLLQQIAEAFATAHKVDPAIPELIPAGRGAPNSPPGVPARADPAPTDVVVLGTRITASAKTPK